MGWPGMKRYQLHNCAALHRNSRTFMTCAIPRAAWVRGTGPYAVIAWCRVPTVTLWDSPLEALDALLLLDRTGCGGMCSKRHDLLKVVTQ